MLKFFNRLEKTRNFVMLIFAVIMVASLVFFYAPSSNTADTTNLTFSSETAAKVGSSHDRANVLLSVASRGPLSTEARKLYIAASRNMGTHDENRVLAALVKAESR